MNSTLFELVIGVAELNQIANDLKQQLAAANKEIERLRQAMNEGPMPPKQDNA